MITLSSLPINSYGIIREIDLDKTTKLKLLELGILSGVKIKLKNIAPLGDPISIQIKGQATFISISKKVAIKIFVTPV